MPSDPLIDVDALTAPIPGDDPAGGPTPFAVRQELDEARKEIDPATFDADDPMRPTEFQKADWSRVVKAATETLKAKSKDLLVAARLSEALVEIHGFAGLRDALKLLTALLGDPWDRLSPKVDDPDDLDVRAGPFEWLDDADRGGRFPSTVRRVPLVSGPDGPLSWVDWKRNQEANDRTAAETFEKAVAAASVEQIHAQGDDLTAARTELDGLTAALTTRLGDLAPGMTQLRKAIDDCRALVEIILARKAPAAREAGETGAVEGDTPAALPNGPTAVSGGAVTRDALYRQIADIAATLERVEPHSPVPYLLRRAVTLGALPFPEMIKSFVRDESMISEISRELDIPRPNPE